ncbi:BrnT family toxin [Sulfurimonas sp. SAG-AH-194-I05]|nr:BrnT family toxin [Sulfurimonas sp. SAG-AH-194-I05]MDF1875336.1 BrnT family toxin [Sulfurimonas sp. SAG-AH-194-I05]
MIFEYDKTNSSINKSKHNIDFEEAQKLWEDPYSFEIPSPQSEDEKRFLVLGQIDSKNYTAIITYRDTNVRIISVRRSREKESKLYESIRAR